MCKAYMHICCQRKRAIRCPFPHVQLSVQAYLSKKKYIETDEKRLFRIIKQTKLKILVICTNKIRAVPDTSVITQKSYDMLFIYKDVYKKSNMKLVQCSISLYSKVEKQPNNKLICMTHLEGFKFFPTNYREKNLNCSSNIKQIKGYAAH